MGTSHGSQPRGRSAGAGRSLVHEQQTRDEATWKDVWRGTEPRGSATITGRSLVEGRRHGTEPRQATVGHGTKPRARQAGSHQSGEHPLPHSRRHGHRSSALVRPNLRAAFVAGPPAAFAPSTYYAFENAGVYIYIYMYICILDIRDGKAPTC